MKPARGLSLASFITGIAGVLMSLFPIIGLPAGIAAVVLGFLGRSKEPQAPKWMWLTGIITGFVGLLLSILVVVGSFLLLAAVGSDPRFRY